MTYCLMQKYTKIVFSGFLLTLTAFSAQAQEFFTPPADVENVQLTAGNKTLDITWDEGTDKDGLVTGYKIYYGTKSVTKAGDIYEKEVLSESNSHTLTDLTNGTLYYVAITAIDDEDNESNKYSPEISATPKAPNPPTLESIEYLSSTEIIINMSDPTTADNPKTAFRVLNDKDTPIPVAQAEFIGSSVILEFDTDILEAGTTYQVTASNRIQNAAGESVLNGKGDVLSFTVPVPVIEEEPAAPILPAPEPRELKRAPKAPVITPDPEEPAPKKEPQTIYPPMNAQNLQVDDTRLKSDSVVILKWTPSLGDRLADQVIYTRKESGSWDSGYSIGTDIQEVEIDVDTNENYEVRIVTVNDTGLESDGAVLSFSTHLTETGPSTMWGFLAMMFMLLGIISMSRRSSTA